MPKIGLVWKILNSPNKIVNHCPSTYYINEEL